MMLGYHRRHHFDGTLVIEMLTRADIPLVGNSIQLLLAVARQVRVFEQVLAN